MFTAVLLLPCVSGGCTADGRPAGSVPLTEMRLAGWLDATALDR